MSMAVAGMIGHQNTFPLTDLDKRETLIKCNVTEEHSDIRQAQRIWTVEISLQLIDCCILFPSTTHFSLDNFCNSSCVVLSIMSNARKQSTQATSHMLVVNCDKSLNCAISHNNTLTSSSPHLSTKLYLVEFTLVLENSY